MTTIIVYCTPSRGTTPLLLFTWTGENFFLVALLNHVEETLLLLLTELTLCQVVWDGQGLSQDESY
jgi:hypothetical protein